jgi:hypothetical protein
MAPFAPTRLDQQRAGVSTEIPEMAEVEVRERYYASDSRYIVYDDSVDGSGVVNGKFS